jgi:hypothetical protein
MYDEAFGFPTNRHGIALPWFGCRKLCWLPEPLHVFDEIETIPSSVNIWMRRNLSPVKR